jgi:acetyl-CoA synthetase
MTELIEPGATGDLLGEYGAAEACAAVLLCDRHDPGQVAFTVVDSALRSERLTYGQLRARSERFAAGLRRLGIGPGDAVGVLMTKSAALPVVLLGLWRCGAVHVPLFTAFAPPAIGQRLTASGARAVIADAAQVGKLGGAAGPGLTVVQVGGEPAGGVVRYQDLLRPAGYGRPEPAAAVGGDGALVMMFTSGTTGAPKAVPVPVRALAAITAYLRDAVDLRADDVYWNAADPGWAYAVYYAILGPLAAGRASMLLSSGFSAPLTYRVLERFGVTNFAAAPTVYRSLRAADAGAPAGLRLRCASSAGEPLTPDVLSWARGRLGTTVRDHYGQTELGMVIADAWHPGLRGDVPPGSVGRALPGWTCAVLAPGAGTPVPPGQVGRLAVDCTASPLMWFRGYANAPERTAERFTGDRRWFLTGDNASRDEDGCFRFSARDDDVIIMAGYRIGPQEVENVLMTHPAVAEAAVVAAPDEMRGEVLEAHVVLRSAVSPTDELASELQQLVKRDFAAHAYPRRVHFAAELPRTASGKLQRFKLRGSRAAGS